MASALYRKPTPTELELLTLRDQLAALRRTLAEREQALSDLRAHLLSFEGRYIRQVGILYKKLEEWERKRVELHANPAGDEDLPAAEEETAPAPAPPLNLRALFRELAKLIHPDRATDTADEQRRTRLMAQANDAFLRSDRRALERMKNGFEPPPHHTAAEAIHADLEAARAHIEDLRADIANAEAEHHQLQHSDLARLEADALAAAHKGRDLLAEMAARVQGRIGLAMRQYELDLHRIQHPPKGLNVEDLLSAEARPKAQPRYDPKLRRWIR